MTPDQISIIKNTWKIFRNIDPGLIGDTFYSKLFADHPALRRMFPKNMSQQHNELIDMLSAIISRLDRLDEQADEIAALARRHVQYGVRPYHYKLAGNALIWTLKQAFGADWTKEAEEAWMNCYNTLAETMIVASMPQESK